jgi:hypothetical protein
MRTLVATLMLIALVACDDDYPPCSPDGDTQIPGGPVHGPDDPGPNPVPEPGPDQGSYEPTYSVNAAGEVCECGPYALGCVDSPAKAKGSAQHGAYCPYPREDGDPVMAGGPLEVERDPTRPYCKCWWTMYDICGNQLPKSIEVYGASAIACEDELRELLGLYNSTRTAPQGAHQDTGHDLDSIQCVSR